MVEDPALPGTHLYPGFSLSAESAPVWWHRPFGLSGESAFSAGGQLLVSALGNFAAALLFGRRRVVAFARLNFQVVIART